jgi:hypothetical protein
VVISSAAILSFERNRMITPWSYSIINGPWIDVHVQNGNFFSKSNTPKSNLIYRAFRKLDIVEIYCHERQTLHLSAWGWGMYLLTRR